MNFSMKVILVSGKIFNPGIYMFMRFMSKCSGPSNFHSEPEVDFQAAAHSRLKNEFIYISFLGKGGFGDVLLARYFMFSILIFYFK